MNLALSMRSLALILAGLLACPPTVSAQAAGGDWSFGGHGKLQYSGTRIPSDSALRPLGGDGLRLYGLEARIRAAFRTGRWDLDLHGQLIGLNSDLMALAGDPVSALLPGAGVIDDERRWFDLTHEFRRSGNSVAVGRLDRASIAYTGDRIVLRFGRQAVSWGNGLLFTPMDIFNPFDPSAVDKEYKAGDDMLYGQYLQDNGNDLQAVAVVRRDPLGGDVERDQSSLALKYHGFWKGNEFDLLLAEHYSRSVLGVGLSTDFAGAVWRGDLVWSETDSGSVFSAVGGASYSGMVAGRNWTGFLEYHYNGFGMPGGEYSAEELARRPGLLQRLYRGELFNIGRHYLGASATLEMTPLVNLTPNLFVNLGDPSALAQLVVSWSWKEDVQVLGALNLPMGPGGSEYGGIKVEQGGEYLATGVSLFAQLAWYF